AAVRVFAAEKADPTRFIVAHSDGHGQEINFKVAKAGSWVSFDAVGWRPTQEHVEVVLPTLREWPNRVLLSMDSGWYWVGEPNGGKIRDYNYLTDEFLPALRKVGVSDAQIRQVTVLNPASALAI